MAPLSSSAYLVTFTASERLKQKLDRAGELLSHCINPSDLPALIERALDGLLEREGKRRYGSRSIPISRATECALPDDSSKCWVVDSSSNRSEARIMPGSPSNAP